MKEEASAIFLESIRNSQMLNVITHSGDLNHDFVPILPLMICACTACLVSGSYLITPENIGLDGPSSDTF